MTVPHLSIIIPTSSGSVPWPLLHSIKEQSLDSNLYEILLIFNIHRCTEKDFFHPSLKCFFSPQPGVNPARNLGIQQANGEIVLFLDDDCVLKNKKYLESLIDSHRLHPKQMSIGGPYTQAANMTMAGKAYHHIRTEWLKTQKINANSSQVLLGGNASYKRCIFKSELRFSPGIRYGGSENSLNYHILKQYGPHLWQDKLTVEHASNITVLSFLKKAFLQGKGSAFLQKFYPHFMPEAGTPSRSQRIETNLLIYFYDFFFMLGYRTSIFERKSAFLSFVEEFFHRLSRPLALCKQDFTAARHALKSQSSNVTEFHYQNKLLYSLAIDTTKDPDSIFLEMKHLESFYGIDSKNLKYRIQKSSNENFIMHCKDNKIFIFDPKMSDVYKKWNSDQQNRDSRVSATETPILYLHKPKHSLLRTFCPHRKNRNIYTIDGLCLDKSIWNKYLEETIDPYNHFSWNYFVQKNNFVVRTSGKSSQMNLRTLAHHAKLFFANNLSENFYKDHATLLGKNIFRRVALLYILLFVKKCDRLIPLCLKNNLQRIFSIFNKNLQNWTLEAQESSSNLYKIGPRYLKLLSLSLKTLSFSLKMLYIKLKIFLSPAFGFLQSLADEPKEFKHLPFFLKYKKRIFLFLKKWVWLSLKLVNLR